MDARIFQVVVLAAAVSSMGASQRTANFIVTAPTPEATQQIAAAAEQYRRDLAIEWLGKEMPTWSQPCPITVQLGQNMGAGGATSFLFEHGEVYGWRMTIQGSLERVLDSVLPHEVTHTIFATHFRQPLPRWADEGACTTVEHASERTKQQIMLVDFLRTGRGIAFSRMFVMKDYPHDVMPLYSEGYSLARYLIAQKGKRAFLKFLGDGMRDENWTRAINEHYGYSNLAMLQDTWLNWVRQGSPAIEKRPDQPAPTVLASNDRRARPEPNLIFRGQEEELKPVDTKPVSRKKRSNDWHAAGEPSQADVAEDDSQSLAATEPAEASASHQVTRQQPAEKSRQIILEWNKAPTAALPPDVRTAQSVYGQAVGR